MAASLAGRLLRELNLNQHPGNASRHAGREHAADHGAESQSRHFWLPFWRQWSNSADLDPDRAEVGEAAQRIRGDRYRALRKLHPGVWLDPTGQVLVSHEFVRDDLLTQQLA